MFTKQKKKTIDKWQVTIVFVIIINIIGGNKYRDKKQQAKAQQIPLNARKTKHL